MGSDSQSLRAGEGFFNEVLMSHNYLASKLAASSIKKKLKGTQFVEIERMLQHAIQQDDEIKEISDINVWWKSLEKYYGGAKALPVSKEVKENISNRIVRYCKVLALNSDENIRIFVLSFFILPMILAIHSKKRTKDLNDLLFIAIPKLREANSKTIDKKIIKGRGPKYSNSEMNKLFNDIMNISNWKKLSLAKLSVELGWSKNRLGDLLRENDWQIKFRKIKETQ